PPSLFLPPAGQAPRSVLFLPSIRQQHVFWGMKRYHGTRTQQGAQVVVEEDGQRRALDARHDLRGRLKDIHNYVYANDRFKQHAKVFEEMMKLLLVKLYDEKAAQRHFFITPAE